MRDWNPSSSEQIKENVPNLAELSQIMNSNIKFNYISLYPVLNYSYSMKYNNN